MASSMTQSRQTEANPLVPATQVGAEEGACRKLRTLWLAPLLSAGLLYLSYFPVAIGWFAWFALVPWLCLVRLPGRPRRLYLAAWLGGVAFYLPVLQWARVADPRMYITWIALSLYCACYLPLTLYLVRLLQRRTRLPLLLVFPTVWVVLELTRWGFLGGALSIILGSYQHDLPGGFSWYLLGHTQHDLLPIIQIVDLTGVYGVSFLVAMVNVLLFECLCLAAGWRGLGLAGLAVRCSGRAIGWQAIIVFALLFSSVGYGLWRLGESTGEPGPRLALLQTSIDQRLKNAESSQLRQKMFKLVDEVADAARGLADLVVTPETSYPATWVEIPSGKPTAKCVDFAEDLALALKAHVLLGLNTVIHDEEGVRRGYNSAIFIDPKGRWLGRYDKVHRVPFGEYIPVRNLLPVLRHFAPYESDYTVHPGLEFTRFQLSLDRADYTFGTVICYEDTDPAMSRSYVRGPDRPVDFLVNISNDGWFDGSSEHDQHLAICRFRAIECRRAVARSVNMGISAVIDSAGRVLAPRLAREVKGIPIWEVPASAESLRVADWHEYKKTAGVLVATMPIDSRWSFYASQGDVFAATCCVFLLLFVGMSYRRGEKGT